MRPRLTAGRHYRAAAILAMVLAGIWLAWVARPVLTPFVFALVLAYLLAPAVDFFYRHNLPRPVAILVAYAIAALALAAFVLYLTPLLVQQSDALIRLVPQWAATIQSHWTWALARFHQAPIPAGLRGAFMATASHLQGQLYHVLRSAIAALFGVVPSLVSLVVAPILAFYLLNDLERIRSRFWSAVPVDWHPAVYKLGLDIDAALSGYVRGQLLVALVVGVLSGVWVSLLGIPLSALIGAVAFVTDVVPYVGPIAGALPAVALALALSPWKALWVVVGFAAIHQLEGTVIGPKVVGDSVGLHPLVVVLAILIGGETAGVAGLLLAVPSAAVLKVLVAHLYRRLSVGSIGPEDFLPLAVEGQAGDLTVFLPNP